MFQALGMQQGISAPAPPRNQHLSVTQNSAPVIFKRRAVEEAEVQQKVTEEKLSKENLPATGYEFKELIGKGAYGRVYKSLHKRSGDIVAVKVLETDQMDFDSQGPNKDASMEDALKEINVLQRLQQSKATNVNLFYEAFQVHSQLWIVSEYCPGGSITTLRRATGNKLEERHIIPIARELAKGLKSVHDAGIVHRDIKCSNVMISETGRVQIIDFGVAGVLLSNLEDDKRKTVIGTPHWMAPEMQKNAAEIAHGTEVDCWAYGITIYECAMGAPPNARTMPGRQLQSKIRQEPAPRLPSTLPEGLQNLVSLVLEPDPKKRPTMEKVTQQQYLAGSESKYPTSSLAELVQKFYLWEHSGGSRASLFMEGGAAKPQLDENPDNEDEDWNFSTTANFEKKQQKEIIRLSMLDPSGNFDSSGFADMLSSSPPTDADDEVYEQATARPYEDDGSSSKADLDNETRVARGARAMQGLFDESAEPYKYNYGSDLPLRSGETTDSLHHKEVSVESSKAASQIDLKQAPKGRTNRATMNWKWDENLGSDNMGAAAATPVAAAMPSPRPPLTHSVTEPIGSDRPMSETIDLDAMLGDDTSFTLSRTGNTWDTSSTVTSSAPSIAGAEEPEEDDGIIDLDIGDTMKPGYYAMGMNNMLHSKKESDSSLSMPSASTTLVGGAYFPTGTTALSSATYLQTMARAHRQTKQTFVFRGDFPWPEPVNPAALVNSARPEIMLNAVDLGLNNWIAGMEALEKKLEEFDVEDDEEIRKGPSSGHQMGSQHGPRQSSVSSLGGFSGPGEDVGEHIEGDESFSTAPDGDEGHEADAEGEASGTGGRRW